ncbi:hypothetical protein ACFLUS_04520 [Chloroflexota bacterium]
MEERKHTLNIYSQGQKDIVISAARLLQFCASYIEDVYFDSLPPNERIDTYYALDNDVIMLYLQPNQRREYFDIFHEGKNSTTAKTLVFLVGDLLFEKPSNTIPGFARHNQCYLIIRPHDTEMVHVLESIYLKLAKSIEKLDLPEFAKLTSIIEVYQKNLNESLLVNSLKECISNLVELYLPHTGPKAAISRYLKINHHFKLIDNYYEKESNFYFTLPDAINSEEERNDLTKLVDNWKTKLSSTRTEFNMVSNADALDTDAEALANIEYLNGLLQNENKKLVLITGSAYLFYAAANYFPTWNATQSFADLYLRHPLAFLANENGLTIAGKSKDDEGVLNLVEWLNIWFPNVVEPIDTKYNLVSRYELKQIFNREDEFENVINILSQKEAGKTQLDKLIDNFQRQVIAIAESKYTEALDEKNAEQRGASILAKKLIDLKKQGDWDLETVRKFVYQESIGSISRLYSITVWIGLWSKLDRIQTKGLPALRFTDNNIDISNYCDTIVNLQMKYVHDVISRQELEDLVKLRNELQVKDKYRYYSHVIYSLAFMIKGHWKASSTLAKIALAICDTIPNEERGVINGREAAYLACIAFRRAAKKRTDLVDATYYTTQAKKRDTSSGSTDIRFEAEELSIKVRDCYFKIYIENDLEISETVISILQEMSSIIIKCEAETVEKIRLWVLRQTLTNYFSLLIVAIDKKIVSDIDKDKVIAQLSTFKEVIEKYNDYNMEDDPLAHLIYFISMAIWGDNKQEYNEKAWSLSKSISPTTNPYDKLRFDSFVRAIPTNVA